MKNNDNGFTLVELLAVIAILGLVMIIAIPKITKTLDNSKKKTLELNAKAIARSAEEKYLENESYGKNDEITCDSVVDSNNDDYSSCIISFDEDGIASVTLVGKGTYEGLNICNGTKNKSIATKEECFTSILLTVNLDGGTSSVNNSGKYMEGDTITLSEPSKEGYLFKKWTIVSGVGANVNEDVLTLGTTDIEIKAVWVKLISFSINDVSYQAEEGMTYGEWLNSGYSSKNFKECNNGVYLSTCISALYYNGTKNNVYYVDLIEEGHILVADNSGYEGQ